jgi:hypothetical protein
VNRAVASLAATNAASLGRSVSSGWTCAARATATRNLNECSRTSRPRGKHSSSVPNG